MRNVLCILFAGFVTSNLFAQTIETIKLRGEEAQDFITKEEFKYPEFRPGKVYFNNGDSAGARLNYNFMMGKMLFLDTKGDTLEMVNESSVTRITVGKDIFYYNDNSYYQQVDNSETCQLVVKQNLKIATQALVGAFGNASPAQKIDATDRYEDYHTHKLLLNTETVFLKQKEYYLIDGRGHFITANAKNIIKLFPAKKKVGESYITLNKLNLNNEEDLKKLCVFLNTPG